MYRLTALLVFLLVLAPIGCGRKAVGKVTPETSGRSSKASEDNRQVPEAVVMPPEFERVKEQLEKQFQREPSPEERRYLPGGDRYKSPPQDPHEESKRRWEEMERSLENRPELLQRTNRPR